MSFEDILGTEVVNSSASMQITNHESEFDSNNENTLEENDEEDVKRLDAISATILLPDVQNDDSDVSDAENINNSDDNNDKDDVEEVEYLEKEEQNSGEIVEEEYELEEEEEQEEIYIEEQNVDDAHLADEDEIKCDNIDNIKHVNDSHALYNVAENQNDDDNANEEEQQYCIVANASCEYKENVKLHETLCANNTEAAASMQRTEADMKLDLCNVFSFSRVRDLIKLESSINNDSVCNNSSSAKEKGSSNSISSSHQDGHSVIVARDAVRATCEAVALMLQDLCRTAASEAVRRKRKTISYDDVARAVTLYDRFAYLSNVIPSVSEIDRTAIKGKTSKSLQGVNTATSDNVIAKACNTPSNVSSDKENVQVHQMRFTSLSPSSALTNAPFGLSNQRYATKQVNESKNNVEERQQQYH